MAQSIQEVIPLSGASHFQSPIPGIEAPPRLAHIRAMDERQASHGLIQWHGTTIIGVKKGGKTVIAGDGQVSLGNTVISRSSSNNVTFGYTDGGRYLAVVWEHVQDDPLTIMPITAYDAPEP